MPLELVKNLFTLLRPPPRKYQHNCYSKHKTDTTTSSSPFHYISELPNQPTMKDRIRQTTMRLVFLAMALLLLPSCCQAAAQQSQSQQSFYTTSGQDILDPQGRKFLPKGMNLNGWLVPEAYALHLDRVHATGLDSKSDIEANIVNLIGPEAAKQFWNKYLENYVTQEDIFALKETGFNAIRLPFNYRLLQPQEQPGVWLEEGFQLLDKVIGWCKEADIAVLLDMHSVPGGQSHEPYADPEVQHWKMDDKTGEMGMGGQQMLWEGSDEYYAKTGRTPSFNQQRAADIWQAIAARYANESIILGYELMNEPYYYPITGVTDETLRAFYIKVIDAIRQVDPNHIVMVEGNIFAHEIGGLLPPIDPNVVIAFHRIWRPTGYEDGQMQVFIDAQQEYNVPFIMTESGENSDPWIYEIKQTFEENNMGWFFWGFKKVGDDVSLHYEIPITDDYRYVINNWRNSPDADRDRLGRGFMDLAENVKTSNCREQTDWFAAMVDPLFGTEPRPYTTVSLPDRLYAANYDLGNQGIAYSDTRYKNEVYRGPGWNTGWVYRNGGVDIDITLDDLGENHIGYHVKEMDPGEWLKYTVDVQRSGLYAVRARVRNVNSTSDASFALRAATGKFLPPLSLDASRKHLFLAHVSANQSMWWDIVPSATLYLAEGSQTIDLTVMEGYGLELAWMDFEYLGLPTTARFGTNCPACRNGGAVEYRFNPVATSWANHYQLARQMGCQMASITNVLEQSAAEAAMEPYIGYPYHATGEFESSFAYMGGEMTRSSPLTGRYGFAWTDGSGVLTVLRNGTVSTTAMDGSFTNFVPGDPNGGTMGFEEPYLALALGENDSAGIGRGEWVDFGGDLPNPALYKCCTCPKSEQTYKFNPVQLTWEDHALFARENGCRLASISSKEDQRAVEDVLDAFRDFKYPNTTTTDPEFAFVGGKLVLSNVPKGNYFFDWADGGGFHVHHTPSTRWSTSYTFFAQDYPKSRMGSDQAYLAVSLEVSPGKSGNKLALPARPTRGKWMEMDHNFPSPAVYQCCSSELQQAFGQCGVEQGA